MLAEAFGCPENFVLSGLLFQHIGTAVIYGVGLQSCPVRILRGSCCMGLVSRIDGRIQLHADSISVALS